MCRYGVGKGIQKRWGRERERERLSKFRPKERGEREQYKARLLDRMKLPDVPYPILEIK